MGFEELDSPDHARLDGEGRTPTQRAQPRGIEKDEWIVTLPAALTATVLDPRLDAERRTDPADRLMQLEVGVVPHVEDVYAVGGTRYGEHHGVHAIPDVQIALALSSVAEHGQHVRVCAQLPVEVEYMSVRIAFPENRDETENVRLEAEARAVGGEQPFGCQFRCPIERSLHGKWRVLRCRDQRRFPVHRAGGGERDS